MSINPVTDLTALSLAERVGERRVGADSQVTVLRERGQDREKCISASFGSGIRDAISTRNLLKHSFIPITFASLSALHVLCAAAAANGRLMVIHNHSHLSNLLLKR